MFRLYTLAAVVSAVLVPTAARAAEPASSDVWAPGAETEAPLTSKIGPRLAVGIGFPSGLHADAGVSFPLGGTATITPHLTVGSIAPGLGVTLSAGRIVRPLIDLSAVWFLKPVTGAVVFPDLDGVCLSGQVGVEFLPPPGVFVRVMAGAVMDVADKAHTAPAGGVSLGYQFH